jgi:predicted metalloendopeptidase
MKPQMTLLLAATVSVSPTLQAVTPDSQQFGSFGIDFSAQDLSVKPGDDFYRYANGHWLATGQIPTDRSRWGMFDELRASSEAAVRAVIEAAAAGQNASNSNERKIVDYYKSYLDTDAIERHGLGPAKRELRAIAALETHEQYDHFEPLPGLHINGHLTLGENIADLAGLTIAHDAYLISLQGSAPPVIDGVTADQRFFLGWAQIYRSLQREHALRVQILADPHSPDAYRVNGVVRNIDAWYTAFDVKSDDELYLKPEDRIKIW